MADDRRENKQGFDDSKATEETKAFDPVNGAVEPPNGTDRLVIDGSRKEPSERSEERGAINANPAASFLWRVLRPLLILVASAALIIFCGIKLYNYIEDSYFAPVDASATELKTVEIKTGSSLSTISSVLYEEGIIRNKFVFQMYVDFNDMGSSLLAGTYELSPGMTMEEIVELLAREA